MKPCGVCGGRNIIYDEDSGENICYDCGCVVGESRESTEPSRKELFGAKHGVGPKLTPLLHDRGVGTLKVGRMSTARERLLSNMLREVAWVSDKLGVGMGVAEMAAEFVRRAVEKGVVRRTLRASAAAAVYLAANHHGLGRTIDDVAKAADIPTTQLAKQVSRVVIGLNLRPMPPNYEALVKRFGKVLDVSPEVVERACMLLKTHGLASQLAGRKPSAVAAAALYLACQSGGQKIPMTRLSEASGVSSLTLRKTTNILSSYCGGAEKRHLA